MIDRNDFQASDEVVEVERKPRAGVVISVRLSPEEADKIMELAEVRGATVSKIAREALTAFLRGGSGVPVGSMWTGATVNPGSTLSMQTVAYGPVTVTKGPPVREVAGVG